MKPWAEMTERERDALVSPPPDPMCRCVLAGVDDGVFRVLNRILLAECLGCDPDLIDDIVAVWRGYA